MTKFTELNCEIIDHVDIIEAIEKCYYSVIEKKGNYNQAGKNNNNYKNGISTYAQKKKKACQRCGSKKNLMVHHKDGNRKNNAASNHETLCWSCHEKITDRKG